MMAIYRSMFYMPFLAQTCYIGALSIQGLWSDDIPWKSCSDDTRCVQLSTVMDCKKHWANENKTDFVQMEPACQNAYTSIFDRQYPEVVVAPHLQFVTEMVYRVRFFGFYF